MSLTLLAVKKAVKKDGSLKKLVAKDPAKKSSRSGATATPSQKMDRLNERLDLKAHQLNRARFVVACLRHKAEMQLKKAELAEHISNMASLKLAEVEKEFMKLINKKYFNQTKGLAKRRRRASHKKGNADEVPDTDECPDID